MVYILSPDGIKRKYACIKCIKGHRSSKCTHNDRELFEIKKKGRPITQCANCRLLRKTRQLHIKCQCPKVESLGNNNIGSDTDNGHTANVDHSQDDNSNSDNVEKGHDISSTVCPQCSRPRLYCHCSTNHNATYFWQEDIASSSSSNSSERSITPPPTHFNIPVSTTSSPLTPLTSQLIPHNTSKYNHHDTGIVSTTTATTATSATAALPSIHSIARLVSPSSSLTPTTSTMGYSSNNNGIPNNRLQVRHLIIPIHDPSDDIDSDTPIYKSMEESHGNLGEFANNSSEELIHQIYNNFNSSNSSASSPLLTEEDDKLVELARDP